MVNTLGSGATLTRKQGAKIKKVVQPLSALIIGNSSQTYIFGAIDYLLAEHLVEHGEESLKELVDRMVKDLRTHYMEDALKRVEKR